MRVLVTIIVLLAGLPAPWIAAAAHAGAADGCWAPVAPPSPRSGQAAVYDPLRHRLIVFGGWDGVARADVWMLALDGSGWQPLTPQGTPPPARDHHTAIYDARRDRVLVFGGEDGERLFGDVWALALSPTPVWTELLPTGGGPSPRMGHTAILDAPRDRMVVFGGYDGGLQDPTDVWTLALGSPAWSSIQPSGTTPPGRSGHTAIYDAARQRMIVFGGDDGGAPFAGVLALSLAGAPVWSALDAGGAGSPARTGHAAVADSAGDAMIVFGGDDGAALRSDVWRLALEGTVRWLPVTTSGAPPTGRSAAGVALDVRDEALIVVGGWDGTPRSDAQGLGLASGTWAAVAGTGASPSSRYRHAAAFDPVQGVPVMFGGYDGRLPYPPDVWCVSAARSPAWGRLLPAGTPPVGRYGHSAVLDGPGRRIVSFGGYDGTQRRNDAWALAAGGAAWSVLAPAGSPPSGRQYHTAILDARRRAMIVFGGWDGERRNDVWALMLDGDGAWAPVAVSGTPPSPRTNASAIWDPVRDRMIVFGGSDGALRNDVWALDLGALQWSILAPAGTPPTGRAGHAAFYDPVRDRMIVVGGDDGTFRNDVWALSLEGVPAWTLLSPSGEAPPGRRFQVAVYDPVRDQVLVHGGWNGTFLGDAARIAWAAPAAPAAAWIGTASRTGGACSVRFSLSHALGAPRAVTWTLRDSRGWPALPRLGCVVTGAGPESVTVTFAMPDSAAPGADTLSLEASLAGATGHDVRLVQVLGIAAAAVPASLPRARWRLAGVSPDPGAPPLSVHLAVGARCELSIEVFDLAGRQVGGRRVTLGAGAQQVSLPLPWPAPPGFYAVRITDGRVTQTARVMVRR